MSAVMAGVEGLGRPYMGGLVNLRSRSGAERPLAFIDNTVGGKVKLCIPPLSRLVTDWPLVTSRSAHDEDPLRAQVYAVARDHPFTYQEAWHMEPTCYEKMMLSAKQPSSSAVEGVIVLEATAVARESSVVSAPSPSHARALLSLSDVSSSSEVEVEPVYQSHCTIETQRFFWDAHLGDYLDAVEDAGYEDIFQIARFDDVTHATFYSFETLFNTAHCSE